MSAIVLYLKEIVTKSFTITDVTTAVSFRSESKGYFSLNDFYVQRAKFKGIITITGVADLL